MKEELKDLEIGYKLRFNFLDQGGLGPTGYKILELILKGHTLSRAAKELDLSYRFVRGYIDKLERRCGRKIVERRRGAQGGTLIRPCGSLLYFLYKQLSGILELSCRFYNEVLSEAPFRNILIARGGHLFGLLDVFGEVHEGDLLIVPKYKNSAYRELILKPKVIKSRKIKDVTITTVSIMQPTDLEGKILVDVAAIGIYRRPADLRTYRSAGGL